VNAQTEELEAKVTVLRTALESQVANVKKGLVQEFKLNGTNFTADSLSCCMCDDRTREAASNSGRNPLGVLFLMLSMTGEGRTRQMR
jgi:hypothetical protein